MESNWRWNVAWYGLVGAGFLKVARLLLLPQYVMAQYEGVQFASYALFYAPEPGQLPTFIGTFVHEGGHFPWGVPVEPD